MKFPKHDCSMYLIHNEHKLTYEPVENFIESTCINYRFESEEEKQKCIKTNEIWTLQWYPDSPIEFHSIAAPTLEVLLQYAEKYKGKNEK